MVRCRMVPVGSTRIIAHAKVNLMLHVIGKTPGGLHHLQSVFAFTKFGDEIFIKEAESCGTTVNFEGEFAQFVESGADSVSAAIAWYFSHFDLPLRCYKIRVMKNIPVAAGLGGGTSDAAAVLAFLYKQDFPKGTVDQSWEFVRSSGILGADVPVSLAFHLGLGYVFWIDGSGREGVIQPLPAIDLSRQIILVNPGVPLSTAEVFAKLDGRFDEPRPAPAQLTQEFLTSSRNILQAPALKLVPDLAKLFMMFMLDQSFSYFRLTGSGASCFVAYKDRRRATAMAEKMKANNRNWWVKQTEIIVK